jgi:stage V sporulation protein R
MLFEVRRADRDSSFLRRFLTPELMRKLDLFEYQKEGNDLVVSDVSDDEGWEKVKHTLLKSVGTGSLPVIKVIDANMGHSRILNLKHYHDGRDLQLDYAERTLAYVYELWGQDISLETLLNEKEVLLTYDGDSLKVDETV